MLSARTTKPTRQASWARMLMFALLSAGLMTGTALGQGPGPRPGGPSGPSGPGGPGGPRPAADRDRPVEQDRSAPPAGEVTPEQARSAIERRLADLESERERLNAALAALDAGQTPEQASAALQPEDRLRMLRSWRSGEEQRLRRWPSGPGERIPSRPNGPDGPDGGPDGPDGPLGPPDRDGPRDWPDQRNRNNPDGPPDGPPSGPEGSESRWQRRHDRLDPQQHERMLSFIREGNPLLWAELERLRASSPDRYEQMMAEQTRRMAGDEQSFELALQLDRADRELDLVAKQLHHEGTPLNDAKRSALRVSIAAAYEARMKMLSHRLIRMEERLREAQAEHQRMLQSREAVIDQRLEQIEADLAKLAPPPAGPEAEDAAEPSDSSPTIRPRSRRR